MTEGKDGPRKSSGAGQVLKPIREQRHFQPWLVLLFWPLLIALACAPREVVFSKPPIILVDIDTLRADHLGCYGYGRPTSPNIDAFSDRAARFEWAFSQAPNTPPSQASILTSLYPTSHGRIRKDQRMSEEVVTLAESLGAAGYDTAAFVDGGLMVSGFGLEQGFDLYDDEAGGLEDIGPKAFAWMRRRLSAAEGPAAPFLLLIHSYDVHSPYEISPWPYRSMFLKELELPSPEFRRKMSGTMWKVWKSRSAKAPLELSPRELGYAKAKYDGGIRHVDDWFGKLVRFLERSRLLEQSIVVLLSDHGDEFQEHGSLFHDRIYATVTRIPLIIRLPGGRASGVFPQVVEAIDLMPTLLDLAGVEAPRSIHGRSLVPVIEGREHGAGRAISESPFWGRRIAVTTSDYRLIRSRNGSVELYEYRSDPLEQQDLALRLVETGEELIETARRWQARVAADRYPVEEVEDFDRSAIEQLRALGYLE